MNNPDSKTLSYDEKPMYGVWLKHIGWLRSSKDVFADMSRHKVSEVAKLVGGSVRYIDKSLIDLEDTLLIAERKTLWVTLRNLFKHNSSI